MYKYCVFQTKDILLKSASVQFAVVTTCPSACCAIGARCHTCSVNCIFFLLLRATIARKCSKTLNTRCILHTILLSSPYFTNFFEFTFGVTRG